MEQHQHLADKLQSGLSSLNLKLSKQQQNCLLLYLSLLDKWNSAYNLSGIKELTRMVAYHLLDSLAIVPHIDGKMILDVGTGAGLPGIPLAIFYPEKNFMLLDSNGKKTRFLFQAITELGLKNVTVHHDRVENFQNREQIDIVLCRAFATLDKIMKKTEHLLLSSGRLLAMKGQFPKEEIAMLADTCVVRKTWELIIPGINRPRHLIDIEPLRSH